MESNHVSTHTIRRRRQLIGEALTAALGGNGERLLVLHVLGRSDQLSPSMYARQQQELTVQQAAYHFEVLRRGGLIEQSHTTAGNHGVQRMYRLTPLGAATLRFTHDLVRFIEAPASLGVATGTLLDR